MNDLIEALTIFAKYTNGEHRISCEHELFIVNVKPATVSDEDTKRLKALSFEPVPAWGWFESTRFGSW